MKSQHCLLLLFFCCLNFSSFSQTEIESPTVPPPQSSVKKQAPKRAHRGQRQGRYGFYTSSEWVIPNIYDELPKKYSDFMIAKKDNKYGIINRLNEEILPFEYNSIITLYLNYSKKIKTGYYLVDKGGAKGIIDSKGKIVIPTIYPYLQSMSIKEDGYIVGDREDRYGLFTIDGQELHPVTLQSKPVTAHKGNFVCKKDGKFGVMTKKGKTIIPFKYQALNFFKDNERSQFYTAKLKGKFGIISTKEEVIVPYQYDDIRLSTYNRLLLVYKDDKYGILSRNGKVILPTEYANIKQYSDNFFIVKKDDKYGLANPKGKEITPIEYERIERKSFRYMTAEKNWKKGIIDTLGNVILDFNYRKIRSSNDKIIFAAKYGEEFMGVYNEKGEQVKETIYYEAEKAYHYSIVRKSQSGKKALFDNNKLTEITPFQYDRIKVKRDRKKEGQFIISGWRNDTKVQIGADGQEIGSPKISRAAIEREREVQRKSLLEKTLSNTKWDNLITINGTQYLQQLHFYTSEKGVRKVYFFKDNDICYVEQTFSLIPAAASNGYFLKMTSQPFQQICPQNKPPDGFMHGGGLMGFETLNLYTDYQNKLHIRNYLQVAPDFKFTIEALKERQRMITLAQELATKIEGRPGGLKKPYLSIDHQTKEVKVHSQYGSVDNIAFLVQQDGKAFLKTEFWEKEGYYSLSGIWRNVRYIDQHGNQKTGDLDICFLATKPQKYWLRETRK